MAGRKPLPTHLKMVRGTLQKCRMNPDEPTPDPEIPDAPPHLSPEAREEWERLALELYELGILSTIDRRHWRPTARPMDGGLRRKSNSATSTAP